MNINVSYLNSEIQINNSYLKSSSSNETYPYIKGKKFESVYGDNKIISMDSYLNKHYISQMKKQDYIRQEKKILEIIEKLDNKKAFNVLKDDYLKERLKISRGYYLNQKNNKKEYYTNLVNIENYKEKLLTQNKSNNSEGDFLVSLMNFLECKPKKVIIRKKDKKLELLSKYKSFSQRKKQQENIKEKRPVKRNSLQILLRLESLYSTERDNNYLKYFNTTQNNKSNNNIAQNNNLNDYDIKKSKTIFNKTNSTTFGLTNYNNFYHPKKSLKNNDECDVKKNSFNNTKIEDIKNDKDNSFKNSNNELNNLKIRDSIGNKLYDNRKKSTKKTIKIDSSSKQNIFKINQNNKNNIFNRNEKFMNYRRKNKKSYSSKFWKDYIKNKFLNISKDEEDNPEDLKMIDLKIINEKLNRKHVKIMKQFLDKIKDEEKSIKEYSNKLSNSIYLIKKMNQKNLTEINFKERNKSETNSKKAYHTEINESKKKKNYKMNHQSEIKIGNYDFLGKSKYSIPRVNKILFGSTENSKDNFDILQLNLQNEVKRQIQKRELSKKIKLNGRDIIDKLKDKSQK